MRGGWHVIAAFTQFAVFLYIYGAGCALEYDVRAAPAQSRGRNRELALVTLFHIAWYG